MLPLHLNLFNYTSTNLHKAPELGVAFEAFIVDSLPMPKRTSGVLSFLCYSFVFSWYFSMYCICLVRI